MKIMSFNTQNCLHYLEKRIDFEIMAKTINDYSPDVVGLQEMRGVGERADYEAQTEKLSALTGMPYCYFAKATYFEGEGPFGNAILSKIPFESVETVPIPDPCPHGYDGYYETRPSSGKAYERRDCPYHAFWPEPRRKGKRRSYRP
jgi:endonuclease/exonuclease/phosphatase family metal-dependent hydrolase